MKVLPSREPRIEILHVSITKQNKNWILKNYKKAGYTTIAAYVDALLTNLRVKTEGTK